MTKRTRIYLVNIIGFVVIMAIILRIAQVIGWHDLFTPYGLFIFGMMVLVVLVMCADFFIGKK